VSCVLRSLRVASLEATGSQLSAPKAGVVANTE
jgi:hypothetical protein